MKLFDSIVNSPLQMPGNVELSKDLVSLLNGLLEKDPELRWNSMGVRLSEWYRREHPTVRQ